MSWMLSAWMATALLALCRGQNIVNEGNSLSVSGYHLCVHNVTRNVSFLVMHTVPYTTTKPCGGWLHWKTCTVTLYRVTHQTERKTVMEQVIGCCSGYEQVGRYCARPVNRSDELTAKPGSCPTADGLCPRSKDCEWDMDCPGWQKCCRFLCTDPTSFANYSETGGNQFNATVTVKTDYLQLMSSERGLLNHTRLLQAMVTGALQSDVSVYYLSSQPVHPYRSATSLLISCNFALSLHNVTSKLHHLLNRIQEVTSVSVEDVDECAQSALRQCSLHADCSNTVGSYRCACQQGFIDVDPRNPGAHCTADVGATPTTELPLSSLTPTNTDPLSINSTGEPPLQTTSCSPPNITNAWSANVTGTSFSVYWSSRCQTVQTYQVVLRRRSEVVQSWMTNQTWVEVKDLQPGVLYNISVTPCSCTSQGVPFGVSIKTDAQTLDATALLTNIWFTADLHNTSSQAYENLTESIMEEIYQSLSPEMKAMVDSGRVRIDIRSFSPGSVVVNFTIVFAPSQSQDIDDVSTALLHSLMNSTKYTVDKNKTRTNDFNECASGENDCSQWATCNNTWASYTCVCLDGFIDNNLERPGRACQVATTTTAPTTTTTAPTTTTTAPTTNTTDPTTKNTDPTTNSTDPTTNNTDPTTNITDPTTNITDPTTNITDPRTNITDPTTKNTDPTTNITDPTTNITDPTTKNTDPRTNITDPTTKNTDPTTNITDPTTKNTDPTTNISDPTTNITDPRTKNTDPTTNITDPTTNITDPTTNISDSTTNNTDPTTNITNPATNNTGTTTNITDPTTNITASITNITDPTINITAPTTNITNPSTNITDPTTNNTDPTTNITDPTTNITDPTTNITDPTINITAPITNNTNPTTNNTDPKTNITDPTTNITAPITNNTNPATNNTDPTTNNTAPKISPSAPTTNIAAPEISTSTPTTELVQTTNYSAPEFTPTAPTTNIIATTSNISVSVFTPTAATTDSTSPAITTTTPRTSTAVTTTATAMISKASTPTITVASLTTTISAPVTTATFLRAAKNISMMGAISVHCTVAAITVTVAKDFLTSNKIREQTLHLGLLNCTFNGGNDSHAQLTVAWNECGTSLVHNETYYMTSVTLFNIMDMYKSDSGEMEVPRIRLEAPIMCTFKKSLLISADFGSMGYDIITDVFIGSGSFQVTVRLTNGTMLLPNNHSLSSDEAVVVEVSLNTPSEQMKVVINKCWATPTPTPTQNPKDTDSNTFLENSCSLNIHTNVLMTGNSSTSRVSVQIFSIVNLDVIYLHCLVYICEETGSDSCVPDCLQRTARSSKNIGSAVGSSGALLKLYDYSLEDEFSTLYIVGLSCLGIGLSLFVIIGFVCIFYFHRNRIGHYNFSTKPKQETFTYLVFNT
ncbi:uromodulin-like 1 [Pseudoliparis swirei]|uniref:uromodulin-like 1 n=1 Tax=Pseudoliparis swirei TaxID=2059687 RepID=UPI0024BEB645|nr:uromodulin-like 1 [Pseudoliparis swirei]